VARKYNTGLLINQTQGEIKSSSSDQPETKKAREKLTFTRKILPSWVVSGE
jgi:hypothetical protein